MRCMIYMYINVQIIFVSESCRNISVAFMPKQTCRYVWEKITNRYVYLFFKLKVFLRSNVLWKVYTTPLLRFVLILNFPSFASSFNILPIISPPDVRLLFFFQGLKILYCWNPPKFTGQNKEEDEMLQALIKRYNFPLGQMTSHESMRQAKIQIPSSNWSLLSSGKKTPPNKKPPPKNNPKPKQFCSCLKWWL